jgi:folylpolyglutamate synthase
MDHVDQLGPTFEDVAWHKSGIFKAGAPAFSALQEAGPTEVLRKRAIEKKTDLTFVSPSSRLPGNSRVIGVPVQRLNCSLALQMTEKFLQLTTPDSSDPLLSAEDISAGIDNFSWIGRFEVIERGSSEWFLDGAHNPLSLEQVAEWFAHNVGAAETPK